MKPKTNLDEILLDFGKHPNMKSAINKAVLKIFRLQNGRRFSECFKIKKDEGKYFVEPWRIKINGKTR